MEDEINWEKAYNTNSIHNQQLGKASEPKVDEEVSRIVGKRILQTDPKLIQLVVRWKRERGDSDESSNFLQQEKYRNELIEEFKNY
jgi:hypothetical protein